MYTVGIISKSRSRMRAYIADVDLADCHIDAQPLQVVEQ